MTDLEIIKRALREEATHMDSSGLPSHRTVAIALERVVDRIEVLQAAQSVQIELPQ